MITSGRGTDLKNLVTTNDVEKVSRIQGIQLVPRDPKMGAGGELNFTLQDGTTLLIVLIRDSSVCNDWKKEQGFFHEALFQQPLFDFRFGGNLRSGIGSSETRLSRGDRGGVVEGITDQ
jgi:hypothetical protein